MDILEIAAEVRFSKAIPNYLDADCTIGLRAFVDGGLPLSRELASLQTFKVSLVRLILQALREPPGLEPPYAVIGLKAAEHCRGETLHQVSVTIALEELLGQAIWLLRINDGDGHTRIGARTDAHACGIFARYLARKTAEWTKLVEFDHTSLA